MMLISEFFRCQTSNQGSRAKVTVRYVQNVDFAKFNTAICSVIITVFNTEGN